MVRILCLLLLIFAACEIEDPLQGRNEVLSDGYCRTPEGKVIRCDMTRPGKPHLVIVGENEE